MGANDNRLLFLLFFLLFLKILGGQTPFRGGVRPSCSRKSERMRDKVHQSSTFRHVQTETSQLCCKGIKARHDVFWDLNIYV